MKISGMQANVVYLLSRAHVASYRWWGGWGPHNRNTLILTTKGRKTGRELAKPLLYVEDQGRVYVVASYGGNDTPPNWYLNLVKNPQVRVEIGRRTGTYRARTLSAEAAKPIWPRLLAMYPTYADYQKKTSRVIPIVELEPANS